MADLNQILLNSKISRIEPSKIKPAASPGVVPSGKSFEAELESAEIHLSKHAQKRLEARAIELSPMDRSKLAGAMSSLEQKGARDSLVLMDDLAFIVNVPSRTVVTALGRDQMKEQIFTNIDSTMLV